MVSVIAANIKNRREYRDLCDLFDKADSSGTKMQKNTVMIETAYKIGITPPAWMLRNVWAKSWI